MLWSSVVRLSLPSGQGEKSQQIRKCIWRHPRTSAFLLQVKRTTLVDSRTSVTDVKFAPKHMGLMLATCSADGVVRIYEAPDVMNLSQWSLQHEISCKLSCSCISWNPSRYVNKTIGVALWLCKQKIWRVSSGSVTECPLSHEDVFPNLITSSNQQAQELQCAFFFYPTKLTWEFPIEKSVYKECVPMFLLQEVVTIGNNLDNSNKGTHPWQCWKPQALLTQSLRVVLFL